MHSSELEKGLSRRHIMMIDVGRTIGTGLFVLSGQTLANTGPIGSLICYSFVGIFVFFVCESLGEMASAFPIAGSFNAYATRFVDPAFGFAMGWNYFLSWVITLPVELVAASKLIHYWAPDIASWIWVLGFLVLLTAISCVGVKIYGETEFILSIIKICAIVAFVLYGFAMVFVRHIDFQSYHVANGPFGDGFPGIFSSLIPCFFAY